VVVVYVCQVWSERATTSSASVSLLVKHPLVLLVAEVVFFLPFPSHVSARVGHTFSYRLLAIVLRIGPVALLPQDPSTRFTGRTILAAQGVTSVVVEVVSWTVLFAAPTE